MVFRLIIVLFFFSVGVFSQEKFIKHKIAKGENLTVIAKKYGVKAKDIEDANPDAPKVLKLNSVLLIPNTNKKVTTKNTEIVANTTPAVISNSGQHEVQEKENLWVISKKYNISVDDLKKANPSLESEDLKIGQKLNIPSNAVASTEKSKKNQKTEKPELIPATDVEIVVEVKPKETKYLIAKKYGITVAELERQNPFIKGKLPVGYLLKIRTSKENANQQITDSAIAAQTPAVEKAVGISENKSKTIEVKPEIVPEKNVEIVVEVQPNETKYLIAKKYGITVAELERQNPFIKGKLPVGYLLKINTSKEKANQQIKDTSIASQTQLAEKAVGTSENKVQIEDAAKPEIIPATADVEVVVEVQPKETKYAIAKRYGITVAELERQNPFIKGKLPVGYVLKIHTSKGKADAASQITPEVNDNLSTPTQVVNNSEIKKDTATVFTVSNHSELVNQLIVNATENIGTRYRSGGTTKAGFDCSGLMICTFNNFDIKLPRSSIEQSRIGTKVGSEEAQKGDLIFFKTNGRRNINHVGMVVEVADGEIKFVHSSTHGGVMISSTKEPYYQRTFSQVNRVLQ